MAKVEPAIQHQSDAQWDAAVEERVRPAPFRGSRPSLTTVAGGRSGEQPAAVAKLRAGGLWFVMLAAGLAVWTGVIYGLLSGLTDPFN